jgi:maltokinase
VSDMQIPGVEDLLAAWFPYQPWFVGPRDAAPNVRIVSRTTLREADPRIEYLLAATGHTHLADIYQVPISIRPSTDPRLDHARIGFLRVGDYEGWVYDALHDKEATAEILNHIAKSDEIGELTFHREQDVEIPVGETSIVLTHQHANTSLAYGDAALLKVFRRVQPGENPDLEMHQVLSRMGSAHVATLFGWLSGGWTDPQTEVPNTGTLAMLKQFLVTATDGWQLAEASVRDLYAEADLHPHEVGGDFAGEARRLGVAVAEVHADIRSSLPTSQFDEAGLHGLATAMDARLTTAVAHAPGLEPFVPELRRSFSAITSVATPVRTQRVHGDLNLENVLRTVRGWKLIDFEGQTGVPLQERTALDSPLRDVASMLRSLDYIAQHLAFTDHPGDAQIAYRAVEWSQRNAEAFCAGYAETSGAEYRDEPALLRAYLVDKAVQETVYEAQVRPHWLRIPMSAVERLAAA